MEGFKNVVCLFLAAVIATGYSEKLPAEEREKFSGECVAAHNALRSLHVDTPYVKWSDEVAAGAQEWAEHLVNIGKMKHAKTGYGENIYSASFSGCSFRTCSNAVLAWYKETFDYDFTAHKAKNHKVIGHFTQVVWKSSVNIGVGIAYGKKSNGDAVVYIVGRYDPRGNVNMKKVSSMKNNVKPRNPGAVIPSSAKEMFSGSYSKHCGACKDGNSKCSSYKSFCQVASIGKICRKTCGKC